MDGMEKDGMMIAARSAREASKLYGLYLHHCGFLKPLGGIPCRVQAKQLESQEDILDNCFKLWNTGSKIYAECFIPPKMVNIILCYIVTTLVQLFSQLISTNCLIYY